MTDKYTPTGISDNFWPMNTNRHRLFSILPYEDLDLQIYSNWHDMPVEQLLNKNFYLTININRNLVASYLHYIL